MSLLFFRLWKALLLLLAASASAGAENGPDIWDLPITRAWMNDHIAAVDHADRARPAYRLSRTQIWADGIARSGTHAFMPTDIDRTVGAKLQPFHDLDLRVGTRLTRSGGDSRLLSATADWEASWSRDLKRWEGVAVGLAAMGSVDHLHAAYSQALSATLGIPLDLPVDRWRTEFRLSPSMNLDASSGSVGTGLTSEILGQAVIGSPDAPLRSVLNVSVGYSLAPDTRPVASARVEFRLSPNL